MADAIHQSGVAGSGPKHESTARNGYLGSPVRKRSIVLGGHKTSVSLEEPFWNSLCAIARGKRMTLSKLVEEIDTGRQHTNLSSAIRLFVLEHHVNQT